jgi:CubicO group peptidase (beta-lactamase class C family)
MFRLPFIITLFFTINVHGQNISFDKDEIDQYLQQLMREWKIAGSAVGIVVKDSLIFAKGYGYRDLQNMLPVTCSTLFVLGSNTKHFTAVAASVLNSEGVVSLDEPVSQYMPQLVFPTTELKQKMTLRDMLSHTGGVPRWDGVWFGARYNNQELIEKVKYLKPTRAYGEAFLYNNIFFSLAGIVAGQLYGGTWQELIKDKIFSPLQMRSSGFGIAEPDQNTETGFDYIVHPDSDTLQQLTNADYFCRCIEPAGFIVSNVEDLSHWVIALLNNGVYKKSQAIPAAAIEETSIINNRFYQRFRHEEVRDSGYALGRAVSSYKNRLYLYHGGSAGGYRSEISVFPNDSVGIIVLTNTVQGMGMSVAAVFGIADRLFNLERTDWSKRLLREQSDLAKLREKDLDSVRLSAKKNPKLLRSLREYAGTYESNIYGRMFIEVKNNALTVRFRHVDELLQHLGGDDFWTKQHPEYSVYPQLYPVYRLEFLTNHNGQVDRFRTSVIGDPETEFIKVK